MKGLITIIMILGGLSLSAQHVIKVKKSNTITGAFYWEDNNKTRDYLLFTEEGYVYVLENSKKKSKKALKMLKACAQNPDCNEIRSEEYTFEKNIINFSFGSTTYVKDYNGQFDKEGTVVIFKVSETDKLLVVREFQRME